ncbi:nuclease SbcCD subunit C-like [Maniola hyperantus]|uniref:nuclease SbcCD subunit C-like n=1 Tax=Aphantopus hyperantus TaxID=2795564 RepID=UPI00374877A7
MDDVTSDRSRAGARRARPGVGGLRPRAWCAARAWRATRARTRRASAARCGACRPCSARGRASASPRLSPPRTSTLNVCAASVVRGASLARDAGADAARERSALRRVQAMFRAGPRERLAAPLTASHEYVERVCSERGARREPGARRGRGRGARAQRAAARAGHVPRGGRASASPRLSPPRTSTLNVCAASVVRGASLARDAGADAARERSALRRVQAMFRAGPRERLAAPLTASHEYVEPSVVRGASLARDAGADAARERSALRRVQAMFRAGPRERLAAPLTASHEYVEPSVVRGASLARDAGADAARERSALRRVQAMFRAGPRERLAAPLTASHEYVEPSVVRGASLARDAGADAARERSALRRVQAMFRAGPRERLAAPLTASHEYVEPSVVRGASLARDAGADAARERSALRRVQAMFRAGPRERLAAPLTASHEPCSARGRASASPRLSPPRTSTLNVCAASVVRGASLARDAGADAARERSALRRVQAMFRAGPRERLAAPLTASHEYGWWCERGARLQADPRLQHHIRDSAWLKERLRVLQRR